MFAVSCFKGLLCKRKNYFVPSPLQYPFRILQNVTKGVIQCFFRAGLLRGWLRLHRILLAQGQERMSMRYCIRHSPRRRCLCVIIARTSKRKKSPSDYSRHGSDPVPFFMKNSNNVLLFQNILLSLPSNTAKMAVGINQL